MLLEALLLLLLGALRRICSKWGPHRDSMEVSDVNRQTVRQGTQAGTVHTAGVRMLAVAAIGAGPRCCLLLRLTQQPVGALGPLLAVVIKGAQQLLIQLAQREGGVARLVLQLQQQPECVWQQCV